MDRDLVTLIIIRLQDIILIPGMLRMKAGAAGTVGGKGMEDMALTALQELIMGIVIKLLPVKELRNSGQLLQ
jgi:hypothetical protein